MFSEKNFLNALCKIQKKSLPFSHNIHCKGIKKQMENANKEKHSICSNGEHFMCTHIYFFLRVHIFSWKRTSICLFVIKTL